MRIAALGGLAVAASACTDGPRPDALSARCLEAVVYRAPSLGDAELVAVDADPSARTVTIAYRVPADGQAEATHGRIACRHETGDRWTLERIAVDDQELSPAEVALVNAELFLRDLERSPDRFRTRS